MDKYISSKNLPDEWFETTEIYMKIFEKLFSNMDKRLATIIYICAITNHIRNVAAKDEEFQFLEDIYLSAKKTLENINLSASESVEKSNDS
jgi:hypothetical protein